MEQQKYSEKSQELYDRIKSYKVDIDLSEFIRSQDHSYLIDRNKSTRTNHVLRKDDPQTGHADEILSIWKRKQEPGEGVFMYANKLDSGDKGTIIEFVKSRNNTTSLHDVDKIISSFLNQPAIENERLNKADRIAAAPEIQRNVKVVQYFNLKPFTDHTYLNNRGLDDNLIASKEFSGRVFNEEVVTKAGSKFVNTAFPIFSKSGDLIGIERKNVGFHDPERSFSQSASGSEKASGIWSSRHTPGTHLDKLFLCEAPIDCMSYHKLKHNGVEKVHYMASNGPWTDTQIDIVQSFVNSEKPKNIVLGHDNDPQGYKFNIHMAGQLCRPQDYLSKSESKPLPGSGIYTDDTNIKVKCTNAGKFTVKLNFDVSYSNIEEGKVILNDLEKRFNKMGANEEGTPRFDAKVTKMGPNNAEMDVYFPNSIWELGKARDMVIDVRKMQSYLIVEKPRSKDWNLDLQDEINKSLAKSVGGDAVAKDIKLGTGETIPHNVVKSFQDKSINDDFGMGM